MSDESPYEALLPGEGKNGSVNPNFHYLRAAEHVSEELKQFEVRYAEEQPEYIPLAVLRSQDRRGKVMSRWPLTDGQRKAIAAGADIYLELLTFHEPLQPIVMFITDKLNSEYVRYDYGFNPPVPVVLADEVPQVGGQAEKLSDSQVEALKAQGDRQKV